MTQKLVRNVSVHLVHCATRSTLVQKAEPRHAVAKSALSMLLDQWQSLEAFHILHLKCGTAPELALCEPEKRFTKVS